MRVLFTATPGWGHVHPMVPLARALLDRGDDVTWAVGADVVPRLAGAGFRAVPAGLGGAEGMREYHRRFPEMAGLPRPAWPDFMFPRLFGAVRAAAMLTDLEGAVAALRPHLVVHEQAELAGPVVAAAAGLPNVVHSFGGPLPAHRVASAQEWVAPLWEARGLEPEPYCGAYRHLYLDICPPSLQAGPADHLPEVQALRPGAFATGEEQPLPDWVADPGRSPTPLVYVTFGTVFNEHPEVIATVVEALRDLPVRVVATVGPMLDPARLGPQPDHVHVAGYIPQTQVLAHCSAVVSHAGSGTFLAAVAEGLPQLCLPQAADQFANAAACARTGAGLALQPGEVTVRSVRAAAERLLGEASFRAAAARLADELRAMPDPSEVAAVLAARFGPPARA